MKHDLVIEQMDAITAFLQSDLEEEIYVTQPEGFKIKGEEDKVCRLRKAIYGLKQSSRVWNDSLDTALKSFGLKRSDYDPCLYYRKNGSEILILAVYVDDILLFASSQCVLENIKRELCMAFKMKTLGTAKFCLGMRITRSKNTITLDQQHYVEQILSRFGMSDCKSVTTPLNWSEKLTKDLCPKDDAERMLVDKNRYQQAVGCLNYLAQSTRPDIAFTVNLLSRFNQDPGERHWQAVKHALRYLRGTSNHCLKFHKDADDSIIGFSDADWASDPDERKSVTGFVFMAQGCAISWQSKKQQAVAISSCEAELYALSSAIQEAIWWKGLRSQLDEDKPIQLKCDNQSIIAISGNNAFYPRVKHVDIRYNFIKDIISKKQIELSYIPTHGQPADILTKSLDLTKTEQFSQMMGFHSQKWSNYGGVLEC